MYKIREYHGSKVMSLTHEGENKSFSVGIIAPGEYAFGAIKNERYKVTSGEISFWDEEKQQWVGVQSDDEYIVYNHEDFRMRTEEVSSYICFYG